jgi:hypothetical protein
VVQAVHDRSRCVFKLASHTPFLEGIKATYAWAHDAGLSLRQVDIGSSEYEIRSGYMSADDSLHGASAAPRVSEGAADTVGIVQNSTSSFWVRARVAV